MGQLLPGANMPNGIEQRNCLFSTVYGSYAIPQLVVRIRWICCIIRSPVRNPNID